MPGLHGAESEERQVLAELRKAATEICVRCEHPDCRHTGNPDCRFRAAIASGAPDWLARRNRALEWTKLINERERRVAA